ncbi:hypothetical protein TNCV_2187271 [Trichonephila clavipes]|nr:hypothetical protein TNCV_2187271 [Trichonephila clavipes]
MFSISERSEREPVRETIQCGDRRRTFVQCVPRVVAHYPVEICLWPNPEGMEGRLAQLTSGDVALAV